MRKTTWPIFVGVLALACGGPSSDGQGVKTPDEIIAEQEALGAEQVKQSQQNQYSGPVGETDMEKKTKWDQKQAELELQRATRSAASCPKSVTEPAPKGTGNVSLTFGNDGHVKQSSISSPYTDTAVGKCVLRAMAAVIVPSYVGSEETVQWDVDLTADKDPEPGAKPKGGKAKAKPAAKDKAPKEEAPE